MKHFKKILKLLIAAGVLVFLLCYLFHTTFATAVNQQIATGYVALFSAPTAKQANYDDYAKDFGSIADFLLDEYGDAEVRLSVGAHSLSAAAPHDDPVLPEAVASALTRVKREAFAQDAGLTHITLEDGCVSFRSETSPYALYYGRPETDPKSGQVLLIEKCGAGWYHVERMAQVEPLSKVAAVLWLIAIAAVVVVIVYLRRGKRKGSPAVSPTTETKEE